MEIDKVKISKRDLQDNIVNLIRKFQQDTGILVESVEVSIASYVTSSYNDWSTRGVTVANDPNTIWCKVKLDI